MFKLNEILKFQIRFDIQFVTFFKGAISVNYHALNAESRKYFHQMICTSGTALHFNAYHDGNHKCLMYEIARNASQPANNLKELIAYLKTAPADQIHNYIGENVELPYGNPYTLPWAPVIESLYTELFTLMIWIFFNFLLFF